MIEPLLISDGPALEKAGLVHRVAAPMAAPPHRTAVLIHGQLGNEDVMWIFARALPPDWLLVAPRALLAESQADGYSWHPPTDDFPPLAIFDDAVTAVTRFINTLPDLYGADPAQLHLMGFSQGAAVSLATAAQHPGLVRSVASLVGYLPRQIDDAVGGLSGLPTFMAVGQEDEMVPLDVARESAERLRRLQADLTYREYDTGHRLNSDGMRDLKTWWAMRSEDEEGKETDEVSASPQTSSA